MSHVSSSAMPVECLLFDVDDSLFGCTCTARGNAPRSQEPPCRFLIEQLVAAEAHYRLPVTRRTHREEFKDCVRHWKRDVALTSSASVMFMHPAYQRIIGMGEKVLPLILAELEREPDHWFWALKAICGVDPVPAEQRGRLRAMTVAWLHWANEQGIRW